MTKTSKRGVELIKAFEGLRLDPYKDAVGVWTVGYGHTSDDFYRVTPGVKITKAFAGKLLNHDLEEAEAALDKLLGSVQLNGNQYGAVISLMFNIGNGAFQRSTLLKRLRARNFKAVPREFMKWTRAGKKTLKGLQRRRAAEVELFNTPEYLGDKTVKQPVVQGAAEETTEARDAKGEVAAEKGSFWAQLGLPTLFGAGLTASDGLDMWDRLSYSFMGVPVWAMVSVAVGIGVLVAWNHFRNTD